MDKAINIAPDSKGGKEYFYFRCHQGHENYLCISENKGYERLEEDKVIVHCQQCDWKSHPFRPVLFQHHAGGDLLLWVYTTKEANAINSVWNVSFDSSPQNILYPQKNFIQPTAQEKPEEKKNEEKSLEIPVKPEETLEIPQPVARIADTVEIAVKKAEKNIASKREKTVTINKIAKEKKLEDTVEIANPKKEDTSTPSEGDYRYYHYFPKDFPVLKVPQPCFVPLLQTTLFLIAFLFVGFLGLKSCNEKGTEIAQAIKSIQIQTGNSPLAPFPQNPASETKESSFTLQYDTLKQKYQELQKELEEKSQEKAHLEEKYKSLSVHSEKQEQEKKEILVKIESLSQQTGQGNTSVLKNYKDLLESLQKEFLVEELADSDQDYFQPCLSSDSSFLLYLQESHESSGDVRNALKIGWPWNKAQKEEELFKTPVLKAQQGSIPFSYSWDGKENAALLTRIDGESSVFYVFFPKKEEGIKAVESKKFFSVAYPEVLGTPQVSPQGKHIAFLHKDKTEIWVKIYGIKEGTLRAQTIGGSDTSKIPEWSPDNRKLYFLTNNRKGIVEWSLPKDKRIQPLSKEIYGCYLSCSPDGRYLAFFQESEEGKGFVHLTLWDIKSNQIRILHSNIMTVETCRPVWSPLGRFLAVIHSGTQDRIVVYDTQSDIKFQVLEKSGRIKWIDWSTQAAISFSYKEGLFTRPYLIRLVSWFTKH